MIFRHEHRGNALRTYSVKAPTGLGARLRERGEEQLLIRVIKEDGFAPVTPIHHMVNRAGILNS